MKRACAAFGPLVLRCGSGTCARQAAAGGRRAADRHDIQCGTLCGDAPRCVGGARIDRAAVDPRPRRRGHRIASTFRVNGRSFCPKRPSQFGGMAGVGHDERFRLRRQKAAVGWINRPSPGRSATRETRRFQAVLLHNLDGFDWKQPLVNSERRWSEAPEFTLDQLGEGDR